MAAGVTEAVVELEAAVSSWPSASLYRSWARANPGEEKALLAYLAGGARPALATATGRNLVREAAALKAIKTPPPPPPPAGTVFAEAALRPGWVTVTVPNPQQTSVTLPAGKDVLLDLGRVKRDQALIVYCRSGTRVKAGNGWVNAIVAPGERGLSPYWRGGLGFATAAGDPTGPEHVSLNGYLASGPYLTDGLKLGATGVAPIQRFTLLNARVESASLSLGALSLEPAEHCDALQVQGQVNEIEIADSTFFTCAVKAPNHGGKGWMLNDYDAAGYRVRAARINFRDQAGLEGQGSFFIQDTRAVKVEFLEECYADVAKAGAGYQWQAGSSIFNPLGYTPAWRELAPGVASFDAATGITGVIRRGAPADMATRARIGIG